MERRQLEYFLAVAAHRSFTSAAHTLRVAQPSLSHAIRLLERELGTPLFHRLGRGVALTSAGEAFVEPARQIMRDLETARSAVRTVAGLAGGKLDIVTPTTLAVDPLAGLAGAFRQRHPAIDIVIVEPTNAAAVADMVRTGECELGLADVRTRGKAVETLELCRQEVLVVVPRCDRFPQAGPVALREVAQLDLVATARGTATRALMDQALDAEGRRPRIAVETVHQAAVVPLVLAGAGATLLPRSLAEDAARRGAVALATRPRLVRPVWLMWRRGPLSPAAQAFIDVAREFSARPVAAPDAAGG
ncbi:LysR family transcriptional regulator [Streptomyces hygroscopicus]|uniref:LysR family transcriptional regulator n=1 Tax=Streptomyces hygroscopicus TaxID=1912 RepID=UPI00223F9B57|nr:LysR substrate-binding domain-containing protein [Streptomyces hygroscopicus]MCW7945161.1 LysR family transcriptional regulator [Streptomyces hygroscopicus]